MVGYWFDTSRKLRITPVAQSEQEDIDENQPLYCCAVCHWKITSESCVISVAGGHLHVKTNPNGRKFLLRCFSSAAGCVNTGESTAYHSWFAGYLWQFAHCRQCGAQLGWFFNGGQSFYGLIKEQLVRCEN
jgi:hypothetical protein